MHLSTIFWLFAPVCLDAAVIPRSVTGYTSGNKADDVENGICAPLTVIFARGTTELGNIGGIIGPPLFKQLSKKLDGNVALQGVKYPATWASLQTGGQSGSDTLIGLVQQAFEQCPSTKVVLSGYSQGALVIHYALNQAGLDSAKISAIVDFGDPRPNSPNGGVPASAIKEYCAAGDPVCTGGYPNLAHLAYGVDAADAASWIIATTGVSSD